MKHLRRRLIVEEHMTDSSESAPLHLTYDDIPERILTRFVVQRSVRSSSVRFHTHSYFELSFILGGNATHHYGRESYPVRSGDLLAISPSVPHGYTVPPGETIEMVNVNFGVEALGDTLSDRPVMSLVVTMAMGSLQDGELPGLFRPAPGRVPALIAQMEEECRMRASGLQTVLNSLLRVTLIELFRHSRRVEETDEHLPELTSIINVLPLIHKMATSPGVSVAAIAEEAALSPGYFGRRFKKLMGESVNQYIQRIRVSRAIQLLTTTDWGIEEIAAHVGYQDPGTFRIVFRRIAGIAPSNYRRK